MRTFVSIEIPQPLKARLKSSLKQLRSDPVQDLIRWMSPESMHLTLKFLGEIERAQSEAVQAILDDISATFQRFVLEIKGVGCFPSAKRPRVLWVGINSASGDLEKLQSALAGQLDEIGFEKEQRDYHSHLTIGRVRKDLSASERNLVSEWIQAARLNSIGEFEVDSINLMRSDLKPSGAVHTKLHESRLLH